MVETIQMWLSAERKPWLVYSIAGLLGLTLAVYLLGWDGIRGTSQYWETTHNDSVQSIAGLRYYLAEGWSWPPLSIDGYGYPNGTNLILVDGIPALAVVAKLSGAVLPEGFHYFGYWIAFSFMMQAIAMVGLLMLFARPDLSLAVTGSGLSLLQTALLTRYFHAALTAQFLVMLALIIGVRAMRSDRPKHQLRWFGALLAFTFLVHLYLFAMVVTISAAFVVQLTLRRQIGSGTAWAWAAIVGVGTATGLAGAGLIEATNASARGFGLYSMNLLALVVKQPDGTGGQFEGFSYLGLGVIGLLAIHVYFSRPLIAAALRKYWLPVVAIGLMAVFALSWRIHFGSRPLVELPNVGPAAWLGDRFRASGRFVWPLVYVMVSGAIVLTLKRFRPQIATAVLLGALIVQVLDMGPTAAATHDSLRAEEPQFLNREAWTLLLGQHSLVRATPHECVVGSGANAFASRELQRIAAQSGVPITTAAAARQGGGCDDDALFGALGEGELRVVWRDDEDFYRSSDESVRCVAFSRGTVCSLRDMNPATTEQLDGDMYPRWAGT